MTVTPHMVNNRPRHESCADPLAERSCDVVDLETQRWLRRTLLLTSSDIEAIDLELAAEAGLLGTRRRS
jgi:hypothetical protein